MTLTITDVPIKDIKLPDVLLKEHPEQQITQLANSIEAFGFNDPIALDENNDIIEGVGRVIAAKQLGLDTVPAIRLEHLSDGQKRAYRIAHNRICHNSGFNLELLKQEFDALCRLDDSLPSLTGFEPAELEDLMRLPELPILGLELTELLDQVQTCPHCGGTVHVV